MNGMTCTPLSRKVSQYKVYIHCILRQQCFYVALRRSLEDLIITTPVLICVYLPVGITVQAKGISVQFIVDLLADPKNRVVLTGNQIHLLCTILYLYIIFTRVVIKLYIGYTEV